MKRSISTATYILLGLLWLYQHTLSPDHGWFRPFYPHGFCRFYPSCSQFARSVLLQYGIFKGSWLTLKRLGRCHPWAEPAIDLP